jgi:hypothetical protein
MKERVMSRAKLLFATMVLVVAVLFSAPKSQAEELCGDDCVSCVEHADGGITCCVWEGGKWLGCITVH